MIGPTTFSMLSPKASWKSFIKIRDAIGKLSPNSGSQQADYHEPMYIQEQFGCLFISIHTQLFFTIVSLHCPHWAPYLILLHKFKCLYPKHLEQIFTIATVHGYAMTGSSFYEECIEMTAQSSGLLMVAHDDRTLACTPFGQTFYLNYFQS